jgi:hypothetical protein
VFASKISRAESIEIHSDMRNFIHDVTTTLPMMTRAMSFQQGGGTLNLAMVLDRPLMKMNGERWASLEVNPWWCYPYAALSSMRTLNDRGKYTLCGTFGCDAH